MILNLMLCPSRNLQKNHRCDESCRGTLNPESQALEPLSYMIELLSSVPFQSSIPVDDPFLSYSLNSLKGLYRGLYGDHFKGLLTGYKDFRLWYIYHPLSPMIQRGNGSGPWSCSAGSPGQALKNILTARVCLDPM